VSEASQNPSPDGDSGRRLLSPFQIIGLVAAVLIGGFLFWLQASLTYSLALLGSGGLGLQDHLSKAAYGLTAGDYAAGEAEYRLALDSTETLQRSLDVQQLQFISEFSGFSTAVFNIERVVEAA